jgi:hypothetical protein
MEMSLEYDWQILSLDSMPFITTCQNDLCFTIGLRNFGGRNSVQFIIILNVLIA